MFKNYLKGIDGIDTYPILSLVAFFLFFMAMAIWLFRADKRQLEELSCIPFNEENEDN